MFQEIIYPVSNNQQQPSLPPSRFQRRSQRRRLRRQDPPPSSPETLSSVSDPAIVSHLLTSLVSIPPVTLSAGATTPPPSSSESPTTTESPPPSSSHSQSDTPSESPSDPLSSSPSYSESPLTSSSGYSTPTPAPLSTTTQPPYTPPYERTPPPMSSQTSSSSGTTITYASPPPSSSSPSPTPTMSSSSSVAPLSSSSSSSGMRESTSDTSTPPSSSSLPTSISVSTSLSSPDGGPDGVTTTTQTPTLPSSSSSSSSTPPDGGGGSSFSSSPSSPNRPEASTSSPRPPTDVPRPTVQDGGDSPMTTLSEPVTFTTTDASGSSILTVPPRFTTVIVTTLPGGTFTTVTEVVANPPGVLNQGDVNRDSVGAFFQNKGAVAGVFIASSLAICAIVLFVIFALRRRKNLVRNERDAEIAAGLAAAASNQRFVDDEDHPVVILGVPSAMRGRSPPLDDEDDAYHTPAGPVMYSNYTGVGPPTHNMAITSGIDYPLTSVRYTHARSNSDSPSSRKDSMGLPTTSFEPASPTGNPAHGGGAYLSRDNTSPTPTISTPAPANHGIGTRAPSSNGGHRSPPSAGKDNGSGSGNGTGSGSGGTSQPSLTTATARAGSARLEEMHPPEYQQISRPNSSAAAVGYAYEPDPVLHEHQITADLRRAQSAYDGMRSPLSGDIAARSDGSRSMYSQDGDGSRESDDDGREDSRLDPGMRVTGGLASVGPRDHEDYTRRVVPHQPTSPSTGSNSHSSGLPHATH